jgi:hypothetical protein
MLEGGMRADYDSKANAISIVLVSVGIEEPLAAAAARSALAAPDRVVVLDVLSPAA